MFSSGHPGSGPAREVLRAAPVVALVFAIAAIGGCGGSSDEPVDNSTTVFTYDQVRDHFESETGLELSKSKSGYGGMPDLVFDLDGYQTGLTKEGFEVNEEEVAVQDEYGQFTIYFVNEDQRDAKRKLRGVLGINSESKMTIGPAGTFRSTVDREPDENAVIWQKLCTDYVNDDYPDECAWRASKRYGANLVVQWYLDSRDLDYSFDNLDEVMSGLSGE